MIRRILRKLKKTVANFRNVLRSFSRFDTTGERVDILFRKDVDFEKLDIYEKSHFKRYELALQLINAGDICADFACGTGYGSVMLAKKAAKVIGADINGKLIHSIKKRYKKIENVEFIASNLLALAFENFFETIISFETIEHFAEDNIEKLLLIYNKALKPGGKLIMSTPFKQERSEAALKLGHHLTYYIDEDKILEWFDKTGFKVLHFSYQNYDTHVIESDLIKKDFIICEAQKIEQ